MAYPAYGEVPQPGEEPNIFSKIGSHLKKKWKNFGEGELPLYSTDATNPWGESEDVLDYNKMAQQRRYEAAMLPVQQALRGMGGQMIGSGGKDGKYQHYVPDYGQPVRALAASVLGQQAIGKQETSERAMMDAYFKRRKAEQQDWLRQRYPGYYKREAELNGQAPDMGY